jgi:hypothetical protein
VVQIIYLLVTLFLTRTNTRSFSCESLGTPPASSGATSVWGSLRGRAGSPLARLDRTPPFPRTLSNSHPRVSSQVLTWAKRAPRVALATLSGARLLPLAARRLKRVGALSALTCAAVGCTGAARTRASARGPTSSRRPRRGASGPERAEASGWVSGLGIPIGCWEKAQVRWQKTHIARARVGAPVAHARHERRVGLGDRVVLAVGAREAERVVGRAL